VHKTANVLNKLPKSLQAKAKRALHNIWMAETRNSAEVAFDAFIETYGRKYEKAVECLTKDRDTLLASTTSPLNTGGTLRTTNPIESAFATVRHRTTRSKGCLSNKMALGPTANPRRNSCWKRPSARAELLLVSCICQLSCICQFRTEEKPMSSFQWTRSLIGAGE
jgi:transposase-like protein